MTMLGPFSLRAENSCDGCLAIAPDSVSILGMQWKGKIEGPMVACIMTTFANDRNHWREDGVTSRATPS